MRRNVRKRNMYASTSKKMQEAYVATFPLHCFNYLCSLTETSQYTWLAHFGLLTHTCYFNKLSVSLSIVEEKQTWPRCGITPFQHCLLTQNNLSTIIPLVTTHPLLRNYKHYKDYIQCLNLLSTELILCIAVYNHCHCITRLLTKDIAL